MRSLPCWFTTVIMTCALATGPLAVAQQRALPEAPQAALVLAQAGHIGSLSAGVAASAPADAGRTLTRQQAEALALKNNPRIRVAQLTALADAQLVRETRAAELPNLNAAATVVGAEQASRLSAGTLSASRLLNHAGAGIQLTQLITDFGRTHNLVKSSSLQAQASQQSAEATREEIVVATDLAFYTALEAQATLQVARQTVKDRTNVSDQVSALAASKLKSTLDRSFAEVNLSQAQLLELDSQNQAQAAMASLDELLGEPAAVDYTLVDDGSPAEALPPTAAAAIALALQQRPDLHALQLGHQAAVAFSHAQHEQLLPTLSGQGVVGATPVGSSQYFPQDWYGAAGVNLSIPVFSGFRYQAEAREAALRAAATDEQRRELADRIVRDVRTAYLRAQTAQQRMVVTAALLQQTSTALDLAQTRYNLGLSSIVELSQAQLQQTSARIADANARYEFEAELAALRFESGTQP